MTSSPGSNLSAAIQRCTAAVPLEQAKANGKSSSSAKSCSSFLTKEPPLRLKQPDRSASSTNSSSARSKVLPAAFKKCGRGSLIIRLPPWIANVRVNVFPPCWVSESNDLCS